MSDYERIKKVVESIIKNDNAETALSTIKDKYKCGKIHQYINKEKICDEIQSIIDGFNPEISSADVVMYLYGFERKNVVLTNSQKEELSELIDLIKKTDVECNHEILAVIPLLHGGGFTPIFALPEIVCVRCWLNVTLLKGQNPKTLGLEINEKDLDEFHRFADKCLFNPLKIRVVSSSKIKESPEETYNLSQKYLDDYKITIIDKTLFESKNGI